MRRAPTSDWRATPRLYRNLHATIARPIAAVGRLGIRGVENYVAAGDVGAVVASNHVSAIDPFLISAACPRGIGWLGKVEVFENPIGKWFFTRVGAIPVDRRAHGNREAFEAALRALERRRLVGIFPEGTRGEVGNLRPPKTGVARLALLAGVPVIPVAVLTDRYLPKGARFPNLREPTWIRVGEPMRFSRDPALADDPAATRKVAGDVMDRIRAHLAECVAARERGERWPRAR